MGGVGTNCRGSEQVKFPPPPTKIKGGGRGGGTLKLSPFTTKKSTRWKHLGVVQDIVM